MKMIKDKFILLGCIYLLLPFHRLFAADCTDYYYGLGVKKDYKKAFDCFKAQGADGVMYRIMMCVNGQGVSVDLKKAKSLLESTDGEVEGADYGMIESEIRRRMKDPKGKFPPLTCGDIAGTTLDINVCASFDDQLEKQKCDEEIKKVEKYMRPEAKRDLENLKKQFEIYDTNDSQRVMLDYIDGTERTLYEIGQSETLREDFQKKIEVWLIKRGMHSNSLVEFKAADNALNVVYQGMRANSQRKYKEMVAEGSEYTDDYKDYLSLAKVAERAWIEYRDSWVRLLKTYKPSGNPNDLVIEYSVGTQLSRERINEMSSQDN